jgi:hypothetical protein
VEPGSGSYIAAEEIELAKGGGTSLLVYNVIAIAMFVFAVRAGELGFILVIGLFAAFGVGGLFLSFRAAIGEGKFGDVRLRLEGSPTIGGRLAASVELPPKARDSGVVTAYLRCTEVRYDKQRQRTEGPGWGTRVPFKVTPGRMPFTLRMEIDVPEGLHASDDPGPKEAVVDKVYGSWELKLAAELDGVDFERTYVLPVQPAVPGAARLPPIARPEEPAAEQKAAPAAGSPSRTDETSTWMLVALNIVPVVGVIQFGWRVHEIVFLYWIENIIVGLWNVMRIAKVEFNPRPETAVPVTPFEQMGAKAMLIVFFFAHYGAFCAGHGEMLASFFPNAGGAKPGLADVLVQTLSQPVGLLSVLAILLIHGYSYLRDFVGKREYLTMDVADLMMQPYKRVFVTQVFIMAGGMALQFFSGQAIAIIIFVASKIAVDVSAHRRERRQLAPGA